MNNQKAREEQELKLLSRKHLDVDGVREVIKFDEEVVDLLTSCGELSIEGKNLKISVLDTDKGVVSLDGIIDALYYSVEQEEKKRGFLGRLLS